MKVSGITGATMFSKILCFVLIWLISVQISEAYISYFACDFQNESICNVHNITPIVIEDQAIQMWDQNENYENTSIIKLNFDSPNLINYIPTTIFRIFPNLQIIQMNNVSMSNLTTDAFAYCDNLTTISIIYNNFPRIPSKFAYRCKNLNKISLNYNLIVGIDEDAISGLKNLKVLDLSHNKISCIPSKLFESSLDIQNISFKNNEIKVLDKELFGKLRTIKIINFDGNKIAFIPMMSFDQSAMKNSLNLILNDNPLYAIEPKFIEKVFTDENSQLSINLTMTKSEGICIPSEFEHKVIQQINFKSADKALSKCYAHWSSEMSEIKSLCHVSESDNSNDLNLFDSTSNKCKVGAVCRYYIDHLKQYTCVIEDIDSSSSYISGNHISELFSDNEVISVFIRNSMLSTIPSIVFEKFPNLTFLTISNSTMTFIHERTLTKCENLKYLDVSDNNILHISKYAFRMCSNLQIIDLSKNPIEYFDIQYARRLKRVYLNKKSLFD
ncbi:carboxypeptidase N subunit 2-like [Chironomus tepperi]|uniref:carboxypeptidase N subunit 2-like n=1 Tax=Chironomus tepperi TaxID=113505 RepID=UPI00391F30A8